VAIRNAKKKVAKLQSSRKMALQASKIRNGDVLDCLSEVREIIALPEYDHSIAQFQQDNDEVVISAEVKKQMKVFVSCIASMYRGNYFHNFEHASHVLMSVTKLMSRIVAPSELENHTDDVLHDHTYGMKSKMIQSFYNPLLLILSHQLFFVFFRYYLRSIDPVCLCSFSSYP
jgi:hypothetical protein